MKHYTGEAGKPDGFDGAVHKQQKPRCFQVEHGSHQLIERIGATCSRTCVPPMHDAVGIRSETVLGKFGHWTTWDIENADIVLQVSDGDMGCK